MTGLVAVFPELVPVAATPRVREPSLVVWPAKATPEKIRGVTRSGVSLSMFVFSSFSAAAS